MMNYGIDPDRYRRDLHQILWGAYSGLAKTGPHPPERTRGQVQRFYYDGVLPV